MMLSICTKFCKNILNSFEIYRADNISIPIIMKGHNLIKKKYMELQVLFSAHCPIMLYIYIKNHEKS